jgi:hypothetical protein
MEPLARKNSNGSAESKDSGRASSGRSDINGFINAMASSGPGMGGSNPGAATRSQGIGQASSTSSRSSITGKSGQSLRSSGSKHGVAGATKQHKQHSDPGALAVTGNRTNLRPARVAASSGAETTMSPMNSPPVVRNPSQSPFFTTISSPSPLGSQQVLSPPPIYRRSSSTTNLNSRESNSVPSSPAQPSGTASGLAPLAEEDATPRSSSPLPVPPSHKHITDFKKPLIPQSDGPPGPYKILVVEDEVRDFPFLPFHPAN